MEEQSHVFVSSISHRAGVDSSVNRLYDRSIDSHETFSFNAVGASLMFNHERERQL